MKKSLLTLCMAMVAMAINAATWQDAPQAQWFGQLKGSISSGQEWIQQVIPQDGDMLMLLTVPAETIDWNGEEIEITATGTAANSEFALMKINDDHQKVWIAYTDYGNVAAGDMGVASMAVGSDGAIYAVFACANNATKNDGTGRLLSMTDAQGQTQAIYLADNDNSVAVQQLVIAKFTADGALTKIYATQCAASADKFAPKAMAIDANDNLYIAGQAAGTVVFADGKTLAQDGAAVVKFNSDLEYQGALDIQAEAGSTANMIRINGDKLVIAGVTTPTGDFKVGSVTINAAAASFSGVWYAQVATDFATTDYAKYMPGTASVSDDKHNTQVKNLSVGGSQAWIALNANGGFTENGSDVEVVACTKTLEGAAIGFDVNTGAFVGAIAVHGTSATNNNLGLTDIIIAKNALGLYYYDMLGTKGAYLAMYDPETFEPMTDGNYQLMSTTGTPTAMSAYYDWATKTMYALARTNNANTTFYDSDYQPEACAGFDTFLMAYTIDGLEQPDDEGGVVLPGTDANGPVVYYNLQGMRIAAPAPGQIYIQRQGNTAKVVINR